MAAETAPKKKYARKKHSTRPRRQKKLPKSLDKLTFNDADWQGANLSRQLALNYAQNQKKKPIDIVTLIVLRKTGLSYAKIGTLFGLTRQTVRERLIPYAHQIETLKEYRAAKADILSVIERRLAEGMTEEKIKKAGLNQIAYAFAQVFDKGRLQEGKSTANISYRETVELRIKLERELKQLKEMGPEGYAELYG